MRINERSVVAVDYIDRIGIDTAPPSDRGNFVLDRTFVFVVSRYQIPLFVGTVNTP